MNWTLKNRHANFMQMGGEQKDERELKAYANTKCEFANICCYVLLPHLMLRLDRVHSKYPKCIVNFKC